MGCNCGKGRAKTPAVATTDRQRPAPIVPPRQSPRPAPPPPMGSGRTQSFVLTDASGRVQSFGSRLEAAAAAIRWGGEVSART